MHRYTTECHVSLDPLFSWQVSGLKPLNQLMQGMVRVNHELEA